MTQAIIFTNKFGGVSVCTPTGELPIEQVQAKDTPAGSLIVSLDSLPNQNKDFFNAWELVGTEIVINLSKAKELTKTRLRAERTTLLQAQDVAFQRALETGSDTTAIIAEKQRLRDLPNLADAASSLESLRAIKA